MLGDSDDLFSVTPENCVHIQNNGLEGYYNYYDDLSVDCGGREFYRICYNSRHDEPYYSDSYNYYCDEYHKTPQREWRLDTVYPFEKFDTKYGIGGWNGTKLGMQFAVRADYYGSDRTIEAWVDDIIVSEIDEVGGCDQITVEANKTTAVISIGADRYSSQSNGWFVAVLNASTHALVASPETLGSRGLIRMVKDELKWGQLLAVATVGNVECDSNCSEALVSLGSGYYPFTASAAGAFALIGRAGALDAHTMPSAAADFSDGDAIVRSRSSSCYAAEESIAENIYFDSVILDAEEEATTSLNDVTTFQLSNYSHGFLGCYRWDEPSYWNSNSRKCADYNHLSAGTCSQCCAESGFGFAMIFGRYYCYCGSDLSEYGACDYYEDCGSPKIDDSYCRYTEASNTYGTWGDIRQQAGYYYRTVSVYSTLGSTEMLPGDMDFSCNNALNNARCGYAFDGDYGTYYASNNLCTSRASCTVEPTASIDLTFKGGKQYHVAKFRVVWYDDNTYHPQNWNVSYRVDSSSEWVTYFETTTGQDNPTNAYTNYRDGVDGPGMKVNGIRISFDAFDQSQTRILIREVGLSVYESEAVRGRSSVLRANGVPLDVLLANPTSAR